MSPRVILSDLPREDLEGDVEQLLHSVLEGMIPEEPTDEDLVAARDYLPVVWFGGRFTTAGVAIEEAGGRSIHRDKPHMPGRLRGRVIFYHPCLPVLVTRRGLSESDDRTGLARRRTRRLRHVFTRRLIESPLGSYIKLPFDSRAGDRNEVGERVADEGEKDILWLDSTEFYIDL